MRNRIFIQAVVTFLLLTGISLGGYDLSGGIAAPDTSTTELAALGSGSQAENAVLTAGAV